MMNALNCDNEMLNSFEKVVPILRVLFDGDAAFAITNREEFLKVHNSPNLSLKAEEGMMLPEGGAAKEALKTEQISIKIVPKEIYGIPFKSYAIPIKGEGGVEGVILAGKSLEKKEEVLEVSRHLSSLLQQITEALNSLSMNVSDLVNMNSVILDEIKEVNAMTKDTDAIIEFVQRISTQTNLLGLNAAIEAARAGELGKGFSVVAQEIRKLSQSTSDSLKKIDFVLKSIKTSINGITENITDSNHIFLEQASTFQEIASSVQELNSTAQIMEGLAEKV